MSAARCRHDGRQRRGVRPAARPRQVPSGAERLRASGGEAGRSGEQSGRAVGGKVVLHLVVIALTAQNTRTATFSGLAINFKK